MSSESGALRVRRGGEGDIDVIARGQIAAEDARAAELAGIVEPDEGGGAADRVGLLLLDTDLLSTIVYSHHYYAKCPAWIEAALPGRAAGLYLLAGIDVPWVADGDQRDRGDVRDEMQELFRVALVERGLRFVAISGAPEARLSAATAAIDRLPG